MRSLARAETRNLTLSLTRSLTRSVIQCSARRRRAVLAELPVQFGLYSSFMGVLIYWFFATSKDITIGPVAVLSTVVGSVVLHAKEIEPDI